MWLICFQPLGTNEFVPQIICYSEQEARNWVRNAPMSVVGSYAYMFVPTASPIGYFKRQESYQSSFYQSAYSMRVDSSRKQYQLENGDHSSLPAITY